MLAVFVGRVRRKQLQILRSIILRVVVPMVNHLAGNQEPTEHLLHYQTVLPHVPVAISVRMLWS